MTSEERREARYKRRKAKRLEKKKRLYNDCFDFSKVFTYDHLYKAYKKCIRSVSWKASVQRYIVQAPLNIKNTHNTLMNGKFKSPGFYEFDLYERGKHRHIRSVGLNERVVQRCLCDNSLVPLVGRSFIYDNGACQEGRGYHFAVRRIQKHLQSHFRKYGTEGYILLFDFRKFFENVSHRVIKAIIQKEYQDKALADLIEHFVDAFGDHGLGLGSQISQTFALASADPLDHYIKEVLRVKEYGRYMDDGYLIHRDKSYLKACLEHIRELCRIYEIELNEKKTHIVKLTHGFTWLKIRFFITPSGKIVKKIYKKSVTRMRRKLKKLNRFVRC